MGYKLAVFGTVAVLVQVISSQCIGNINAGPRSNSNGFPYGPNLAGPKGPAFGPNLGPTNQFCPNLGGIGPAGPGSASGGSFAVKSTSPVSPTGVSVLAENLAIEGPLSVGGNLPFLGTVGLEGALPGGGAGSVSYGCGNGNIGINENAAGLYGTGPPAGLGGPFNSIAPAGPYGANGPLGPSPAAGYGLSGSPIGPGAGVGSPFGLAGSGTGAGFGAGLGVNGYNGVGFNGLRN